MKLKTTNDFEKIVIEEIPLIDVRAPIEFEKGAFINAANLPIMNNEERRQVGICYKEKGNTEATKLGHQLVTGKIKESRIEAWEKQLNEHPNSIIYCFRGGQRSQISQQWIAEQIKKEIMRLEGGYKAFRNYLIKALEPEQQQSKPLILGGCTGSGKTILLKKLDNAIDLEGIANHRGSSFGNQITPQPTPINFENNLAYALIQHKKKAYQYMILEDEGKNVGKCFLPKSLAAHFSDGDLVVMDVSLEERVEITMNEYVVESQVLYQQKYGEQKGLGEWENYILDSLNNIKRRLGGQNHQKLVQIFKQAYAHQMKTQSNKLHRDWITMLLRDYYDPMYEYQIQKTTKNIVFRGNTEEVLQYFKSLPRYL